MQGFSGCCQGFLAKFWSDLDFWVKESWGKLFVFKLGSETPASQV
jgi:hypothetical protein